MRAANLFLLLFLFVIVLTIIPVRTVLSIHASNPDTHPGNTLTVEFTVLGEIQTDDPWTRGSQRTNQWAKPMYRIWFDGNGNPNDGPYGNGQGPMVAQLWLDTGKLGFLWCGPDGKHATSDDMRIYPLKQTEPGKWHDHGIIAEIHNDGRSLKAVIPLSLMGNPGSLDIGFMASPWTSSASDNLGQGANSRPAWITVKNTGIDGSYSLKDKQGDNAWPKLTPSRKNNFDLVQAVAVINTALQPSPSPEIVVTPVSGRKLPVITKGDNKPAIIWKRNDKEYRVELEWKTPGTTHRLELNDVYEEEDYLYFITKTSCQGCLITLYMKQGGTWKKQDSFDAMKDSPLPLRVELDH